VCHYTIDDSRDFEGKEHSEEGKNPSIVIETVGPVVGGDISRSSKSQLRSGEKRKEEAINWEDRIYLVVVRNRSDKHRLTQEPASRFWGSMKSKNRLNPKNEG